MNRQKRIFPILEKGGVAAPQAQMGWSVRANLLEMTTRPSATPPFQGGEICCL
jgi:hypothetical protein